MSVLSAFSKVSSGHLLKSISSILYVLLLYLVITVLPINALFASVRQSLELCFRVSAMMSDTVWFLTILLELSKTRNIFPLSKWSRSFHFLSEENIFQMKSLLLIIWTKGGEDWVGVNSIRFAIYAMKSKQTYQTSKTITMTWWLEVRYALQFVPVSCHLLPLCIHPL